MTIQEIQDEIISDFELFDDWDDKYGYIIELGKKLPVLAPEYKTEENLVRGCQSQVWLHAYTKDGKIFFEGDSDAIIVKGLVSLLIKVLSEHTPEEISQADLYFLSKVGLQQHLSMTRANGLASMIKQMKAYSLAFQNA
ncbi:MAG: SufE family protein [Raineya sp.]|jgi:cysteine desulfuration protein SufE|nr:SufE family protein [Raineya sp.]